MTAQQQREITTTRNADLLRDRCEALEYLLSGALQRLREADQVYAVAEAFDQGRYSVEDVLKHKEMEE